MSGAVRSPVSPVHYYARLKGTALPGPALNVGVRAPEGAVALAVDVLVAAARARHGDRAVLNALTRRERDAQEALRVL